MMESHLAGSQLRFTNSTGEFIDQIYTPLHYRLPGKTYPSPSLSRKESHSLITYARRLLGFLLSIQLRQLAGLLTFKRQRTLHSAYRGQSLAILSNSQDLHSAICKAQEYNIPLLQIVILTASGEEAVRQKVLLNFAVSHFINQNFVLYGDWERRKEIEECLSEEQGWDRQPQGFDTRQGLFFRRGELIYAFIPLSKVSQAHEHLLQQNLTKVRNIFYLLDSQHKNPPEPEPELSPEPSSELQPNLSQFGAMGAGQQLHEEELIDNFNDSDHEWEPEN